MDLLQADPYGFSMLNSIPNGFLVAIEGIDGAGKTTQVNMLAEACRRLNLSHVISKEPTNGKYGSILRQSAATGRLGLERELELFMLDRQEHVQTLVQPALDEGKVVILDRYYYSTAAYQGALGGDPDAIIFANETFAPVPDLLALLDLPCNIGLARIHSRGDQPNLFEREEMLSKARQIFLGLKHPRLLLINGKLPVDKVHETIRDAFRKAALEKIARSQPLERDSLEKTMQVLGAPPENL